jgi:hypothetical protein
MHTGIRALHRAAVIVAAATGLVMPVVPSSALAAPKETESRYCAIIIEKLKPGEKTSKVVREATCGADHAAVTSQLGPMTSTLLMHWCQNANCFGGWGTDIYGSDGPCDQLGYGISFVGWGFNDAISAWNVYNSCNNTWAFDHENYYGDWQQYYGNVGYCGNFMNDRISSFKIFK